MIPFKVYDAFLSKDFYNTVGYVPVVARHLTGGIFSRFTH